MDERPSNVAEDLLRDAVASSRQRGALPRVNDVKKYIVGCVEDLERRNEDGRQRIKPKPVERVVTKEQSSEDMEKEYARRLRRRGLEPLPGSWSVSRAPIQAPARLRTPSSVETRVGRRLRRWASSADPFASPKWGEKLDRFVATVPDRRAAAELLRNAVREALMRQRLRLLRTKPEWADRLKVNPLAVQGALGAEKQAHAHQVLRAVIEDSDRVFGPWLKVPAGKLVFAA